MAKITIDTEKMPYTPSKIECLRFGGRIGGEGIGCCGMDIFQGFDNDPDAEAYVPLFNGDEPSYPVTINGGAQAYLGPTNKDIFLGYLRIGTFDRSELPNRGFLAIFTDSQVKSDPGNKWLAILKENGFEFIRSFDNSVYSGGAGDSSYPRPLYLFGLFRNIGNSAISDPFLPPKAWSDLPEPVYDPLEKWETDPRVNLIEGKKKDVEKEEGPKKAKNPFASPAEAAA